MGHMSHENRAVLHKDTKDSYKLILIKLKHYFISENARIDQNVAKDEVEYTNNSAFFKESKLQEFK